MSKEILLEMRTIKKEEFIEWFRQMGGKEEEPGIYAGPFWNAHIDEPKNIKLGAMNFISIRIKIVVEDDKYDDFMSKFRMRFLRAGG